MPVCSYIIHPNPGKEEQVINRLRSIPNSEFHSDVNHTLFILMTDTADPNEVDQINDQLNHIDEIQSSTLSFVGYPH